MRRDTWVLMRLRGDGSLAFFRSCLSRAEGVALASADSTLRLMTREQALVLELASERTAALGSIPGGTRR
jgi:hypothetical protein